MLVQVHIVTAQVPPSREETRCQNYLRRLVSAYIVPHEKEIPASGKHTRTPKKVATGQHKSQVKLYKCATGFIAGEFRDQRIRLFYNGDHITHRRQGLFYGANVPSEIIANTVTPGLTSNTKNMLHRVEHGHGSYSSWMNTFSSAFI
ncbi:hypothetical protein TNCV_3003251 [Trichonephila clavipes]|nr:hypothetical protein TNCV_3003251 [Trichonephila clavipes]